MKFVVAVLLWLTKTSVSTQWFLAIVKGIPSIKEVVALAMFLFCMWCIENARDTQEKRKGSYCNSHLSLQSVTLKEDIFTLLKKF
jgi:hypothetical protein